MSRNFLATFDSYNQNSDSTQPIAPTCLRNVDFLFLLDTQSTLDSDGEHGLQYTMQDSNAKERWRFEQAAIFLKEGLFEANYRNHPTTKKAVDAFK